MVCYLERYNMNPTDDVIKQMAWSAAERRYDDIKQLHDQLLMKGIAEGELSLLEGMAGMAFSLVLATINERRNAAIQN